MKYTTLCAIIALGFKGALAMSVVNAYAEPAEPQPSSVCVSEMEDESESAEPIPPPMFESDFVIKADKKNESWDQPAYIAKDGSLFIPTKPFLGGKLGIFRPNGDANTTAAKVDIWHVSTGTREQNPVHGMLTIDQKTGFLKFQSGNQTDSLFGYDQNTLDLYQFIQGPDTKNFNFHGCEKESNHQDGGGDSSTTLFLSVNPTYNCKECTRLTLTYRPRN